MNLPGIVFMPKLLVTRWRRKKPVYLSSPVKVRATDVEPTLHLDDVVVPVSANVEFTVSENVLPVSDDMLSVKQKVGRPRRIGKALNCDSVQTVKKSKTVKRLVNYQPRR